MVTPLWSEHVRSGKRKPLLNATYFTTHIGSAKTGYLLLVHLHILGNENGSNFYTN